MYFKGKVLWNKEERSVEGTPKGQSLKKITLVGCGRDVDCRLGPG
jgi:hypothetical protein